MSHAACQHIAYLCNERSWRDTGLVSQADAEALRLLFVRAAFGRTDPLMFSLTRTQIRALDTLLTDTDPREGKLPDGTPVLDLVEAIWRTLIGDDDASDQDNHEDSVAGTDAGTPVHRS
ncbi:MAG: hypothetical protein WC273_05685 [Dehalococcoidia bacterium]